MATLVSRNGKIQVKIRKNGANKSSTFATKYEANVRVKQKQNIVNQKKGQPEERPARVLKEILFKVR